jgi:hypothetical protein
MVHAAQGPVNGGIQGLKPKRPAGLQAREQLGDERRLLPVVGRTGEVWAAWRGDHAAWP